MFAIHSADGVVTEMFTARVWGRAKGYAPRANIWRTPMCTARSATHVAKAFQRESGSVPVSSSTSRPLASRPRINSGVAHTSRVDTPSRNSMSGRRAR